MPEMFAGLTLNMYCTVQDVVRHIRAVCRTVLEVLFSTGLTATFSEHVGEVNSTLRLRWRSAILGAVSLNVRPSSKLIFDDWVLCL